MLSASDTAKTLTVWHVIPANACALVAALWFSPNAQRTEALSVAMRTHRPEEFLSDDNEHKVEPANGSWGADSPIIPTPAPVSGLKATHIRDCMVAAQPWLRR